MSNLLTRSLALGTLTLCSLGLCLHAPAQASRTAAANGVGSRLDLYGGYGLWDPIDSDISGKYYPKLYNSNATASLSYYFSRHWGVQVEGSYFSRGRTLDANNVCNEIPCSPAGQRVYTAEIGPVYRYPIGRFIPFAHALGGGERMSGPYLNRLTNGWGVTGGVGIDYVLPYFHNHIAIRPIQADFQYSQVDYGPLQLPAAAVGGFGVVTAIKLSGGIVFKLGGGNLEVKGHNDLALGCEVSPATLYPGDPATVTVQPMNLHPKRQAKYTFMTTGGTLTQHDSGASLSTAGLAPGDYTVSGLVTQGTKAGDQARCTASFTVRSYDPPTLSCSADPSTVMPGSTVAITSVAASTANRPLTYSYSASSGVITGSGSTVQLATAGTPGGTINVSCNVTDDLGKSAQASTMVTVMAAKAAPLPSLAETRSLCEISFARDRKRPVRVNNEAKACLDDIALNLQRDTDAKLVVVGDYASGETAMTGAQRAINVRQYLTQEKGIDVGRIEVRSGGATGRTVENVLVPAGATYTNAATTAVDPNSVVQRGQAYGRPGQTSAVHRKRHHRRAAAAATPAQ